MMVSHHQSWPVVVWMPLRCVKQPGPEPPPTVTSGSSPDCSTIGIAYVNVVEKQVLLPHVDCTIDHARPAREYTVQESCGRYYASPAAT